MARTKSISYNDDGVLIISVYNFLLNEESLDS